MVIILNQTTIFEWFVASRCGCKNAHQKYMYLEEVELCIQNIGTILGSIVNIQWGPVWSFNDTENLHFDNEQDIHMSYKNYDTTSYWAWFGIGNHLASIANFTTYMKLWVRTSCIAWIDHLLWWSCCKWLGSPNELKFWGYLCWRT